MVSNNIDNYEVLSILGGDISSTCYKVKNKINSKIFVWRAYNYESYTEEEKEALINEVEKRKLKHSTNLLNVYDYILHDAMKVIYVVIEYCEMGNLNGLLHRCLHENKYLHEDFLWRILYEICFALKATKTLNFAINLNNVFLTEDYKIKLLEDDMLKTPNKNETTSLPVRDLGLLMVELSTLKYQNLIKNSKQILKELPEYYSNELKEILRFILSVNFDIKAMIDAILCHPTILLKSSHVNKNNIYVKHKYVEQASAVLDNISNSDAEVLYRTKLENLKNREIALKSKEEKLNQKCYEARQQEKKIAVMQKMVKEKLLHAELYLKRSRELKSSGSKNSKISNVISYENLDSTYSADCGDSSMVVTTSKKLNCDNIKKPSTFTRTMSERRVRFKGHSPLKEMYNRNFLKEHKLQNSQLTLISDSTATSSSSNKSNDDQLTVDGLAKKTKPKKKLDLFSVFPLSNRKPLIEKNVQNDVIHEAESSDNVQCRPISWTEESKQHAFELLRIMNQGGSVDEAVIKHTYL